MDQIYFFVLNMKKNPERYSKISNMLNIIGCLYSRVEAIDGTNMEHNDEVLHMLKCRTAMLNTQFTCKTFNQDWVYDGSISSSFPGLNMYGHYGAKGLILSNIKAFHDSTHLKYKWFCVLEDDAEITQDIYNNLCNFINQPENQNIDIIFLDERGPGGSAGNLYSNHIISQLISDLNPLSDFSINMEEIYGMAPLWDWKLWSYVKHNNINYSIVPCIQSGSFPSTIEQI